MEGIDMDELQMINEKFRLLYKDRPSVIRTTLMFGPIGWVIRLAGTLFFFIGIGFLIATVIHHYFFNLSDIDHRISNASEANQEVVLWIQAGISIFCLLIGFLLLSIGSLCRRIVNRNIYIIELEELLEKTNEKDSC